MKLIEEYAEFFNMTPSALLFLFKNQFVNKNLIIGQSRPVKDRFVTYKTITSDRRSSNTKPILPNNLFMRADKMSR